MKRFASIPEAKRPGGSFVRTAAALGVLSICTSAISGCGGGAPAAGRQPVKRVYSVENNVDALRVWTDTRARADVLVHIDAADDIGIFPQSIMDSIGNAARRIRRGDVNAVGAIAPIVERGAVATVGYAAGMYKRIVWIIPAPKPTAEEPPDTYRKFFLESRKFPPAVIGEFVADGKCVTGTVAGIPLTIARLDDLSLGSKETAIVDLDLNYFQLLAARDPGYRTGTKSLLSFLRQLANAGVRTRLMTVNLATQGNEVPMDLRYYGGIIAEALADPKLLDPPPPEKWGMMIQAEDSMRAGRYSSAAALYREILRIDPENAGLHFALAVALGFDERGLESRASLLDAYRLDHEYLRGCFQLVRVLGAADKISTGVEILDAPELEKLIGPTEMDYQRGMFFFAAKRPFDAATYLRSAAVYRPHDFGLHTILFRAYRDAGDYYGERSSLQKLIDIDEGRVRREMPWVYADLGALYERTGFPVNARDLYKKYIELFPSDSLSAVFQKKIDAWEASKAGKPKNR